MNDDLAYWQNERRALYSAQAYWRGKLNEPHSPYSYEETREALERLRETDQKIRAVENQIDVIIAELA